MKLISSNIRMFMKAETFVRFVRNREWHGIISNPQTESGKAQR